MRFPKVARPPRPEPLVATLPPQPGFTGRPKAGQATPAGDFVPVGRDVWPLGCFRMDVSDHFIP